MYIEFFGFFLDWDGHWILVFLLLYMNALREWFQTFQALEID
jgi:hypothetical protein